jgi:hypothetical protein
MKYKFFNTIYFKVHALQILKVLQNLAKHIAKVVATARIISGANILIRIFKIHTEHCKILQNIARQQRHAIFCNILQKTAKLCKALQFLTTIIISIQESCNIKEYF